MQRLLKQLSRPVLGIPRPAKRILVITLDVCLCIFTVWFAYYLRLGEFIAFSRDSEWGIGAILAAVGSILIAIPIFISLGLYRAIFRYSGLPALLAVVRAVALYFLFYFVIFTVIGIDRVPRTVGIIQPVLLVVLVGASRLFASLWLGDQYKTILQKAKRPKVLIYGAGRAGRELAYAMIPNPEMQVVGFLDDDDRLHGHSLNGLPIYDPRDIVELVAAREIRYVLLAIPSLSRSRRNQILNHLRGAHVQIRSLPRVTDLVHGKVSVSDLHELDMDDLLGREPVMPNHLLLAMNNHAKVVAVTGAGGSIGSELARQIAAMSPSKLLLIEQNEYALYTIYEELREKLSGSAIDLIPLLASVQDEERMHEILATWQPHTLYHAAAYKHVPLVEHNPAEGVKNNVLGTLCTARLAIDAGVAHFVLVSTDKAVRPTNIMGASKRLAELVLQALAQEASSSGTRFSMVRFGNVLDSSGSVVPKFRQQIQNGGPITLTHPEVTRYFMTIPEAAQLVIQAGAMAKGGDVFVLDMGEPIKILDLAKRIIELSGLTIRDEAFPQGDIAIEITGLRPGEKLYEELLIGHDPKPTAHSRILRAREEFLPWAQLRDKLAALELALNANDVGAIRLMMEQLVTGYTPSATIMDWVFLEQESEQPLAYPASR